MTKPAWQKMQTGSDYFLSFSFIGDNILLTVPQGNVRTVDMEQTIEARETVLLDHFGEINPTFVEIRDFSFVHGVPSPLTRSLYRKSLHAQVNQKGLFIINAGWIIRSVFLAGMRLHKFHFKMKLSKSYDHAVAEAQKLLQPISTEPPKEWHTRTDSIRLTHKIIDHSILYTIGSGYLVKEDVPEILASFEEILQSEELSQPPIYYRIADYSEIRDGDWRGRILFTKGLNNLFTKHNRTPAAQAIFGLSAPLQAAMQLASKILNYPVFYTKTKDEAFECIYNLQQSDQEAPSASPQNQKEVEDILRVIATIIWDDSEKIIPPDTTTHHLAPIIEALMVVKQDVGSLIAEAQTRTTLISEKNAQLEAEIRRRERTETQLIAAMQQAEAANQAKGDFLATMSHEIRTPLSGILGMIHLLKNTTLSAEQQKFLNISHESATSLLNLINNILDFSKVDQRQLQMEVTPFNLAELCATCCNLFNKDILEKGLDLHCTIAPNLNRYIIGDPGKLRQIIINILSNAIKFTPSGSITLDAAIQKQTNELISITFTITDTGIGIAQDKMSTIFDTFTQADSSTTRQYGGTGLGLSISRKICQFMDGELSVASTLKKGTSFTFTLPFGLGDTLPAQAIPETRKEYQPPAHHKARILIVEDEPVNQLFVEALLDQFGYQHDHAANGLQALESIKKTVYDIILMDCQMPVMDGYDATAKIRSLQFSGHPPIIIALTAHAMEGDRTRCLECGMDAYLAKPIVPSLLLETIEKYLSQSQ